MPSDDYLDLKDIEGESTAPGHEGQIEILSFQVGANIGVSSRSTSGSPTHSAPNGSEVVVTKTADSASPLLFKACCSAQLFKEVIISVNRADGSGGQVEYLQVKLTDVIISSFTQSGGSGSGIPMESASLNYATITFTYTKTSGSDPSGQGSITGGWDFASNQPV